eukprot:Skav218364  [mRNA]  locus=scaffold2066:112420:128947:+ [translate_table: standard]
MAELSEKARFLYDAVLKPQTDTEKARRFFPMLRKWAETGKEYRGEVFSSKEVEEAISAFERLWARNVPSPQQRPQKGATVGAEKAEWWPRWAFNKARGVEVLAPMKGKKEWLRATPIAIGYHGQKKCYLFVRADSFEMDCRRSEVRPVGGGRTVQQQMDDLISRGHKPESHQEWTDGSDINMTADHNNVNFIRPGLSPPRSKRKHDEEQAAKSVKSATCDHPDPLSEPRAAASIRLPQLNENDTLALPAAVAQERLSSLQLETVCFAARRFRTKLPDGRTAGYEAKEGKGPSRANSKDLAADDDEEDMVTKRLWQFYWGAPVILELAEDELGERVVVSKVLEGPPALRRAELEGAREQRSFGNVLRVLASESLGGWHVKKINDKPVGKIREAQHLTLPPNALDDLLDRLGGLKKALDSADATCNVQRRWWVA